MLNPNETLLIVSNSLEADAAASKGIASAALIEMRRWSREDSFWKHVPLKGRSVFVVMDSTEISNPSIRKNVQSIHAELLKHGASATVLSIPPKADGNKQGLIDYLLAGHNENDLLALHVADILSAYEDPRLMDQQYATTSEGLVRIMQRDGEPYSIPLTNFTARITADVVIDNGTDTRHEFEVTADVGGHKSVLRLTAMEFERMTWVLPQLGANAIVHAGIITRDHARAAIQSISGTVNSSPFKRQ